MCIVCKEWNSGKLTNKEALNALGEISINDGQDTDHLLELWQEIVQKELNEQ